MELEPVILRESTLEFVLDVVGVEENESVDVGVEESVTRAMVSCANAAAARPRKRARERRMLAKMSEMD